MAAPYTALAGAANGYNTKLRLPLNYGFGDLANYEEGRRSEFANRVQSQLAKKRSELSSALTEQGKALFDRANPGILEDLNSRGVFSSPTAIATAQGNALRDIGLENQRYLNDFDTSATAAGLSAEQDALDAPLDIRRSELESRIQEGNANREEALAKELAKQNAKNQLTNSLIGLGGNIFGPALGAKLLNGFGGATKAAAGGGTVGGTVAGSGSAAIPGAGGTGLGGIGGLGLIAGAGYGSSVLDKAMTPTLTKNLGQTGGAAARALLNPVGSTINLGKNLISDPKGTLRKAFGGGSGQSTWQSGSIDPSQANMDDLATTLGTSAGQIAYDSNKAGSFEQAYNQVIQNFTPEQLVARYSTLNNPLNFNTGLDQRNKKNFDELTNQLGRIPTPDEAWQYLNTPGR